MLNVSNIVLCLIVKAERGIQSFLAGVAFILFCLISSFKFCRANKQTPFKVYRYLFPGLFGLCITSQLHIGFMQFRFFWVMLALMMTHLKFAQSKASIHN